MRRVKVPSMSDNIPRSDLRADTRTAANFDALDVLADASDFSDDFVTMKKAYNPSAHRSGKGG